MKNKVDLGPCCICLEEKDSVHNVISLPYVAPNESQGWGCVACGLPFIEPLPLETRPF